MYVVIAEDDPIDAEEILQALRQGFQGAKLLLIRNESEFQENLDKMEREPPDIVVLDVMLRWADPRVRMKPAPEDVREEGFYRAGLRCQKLLSSRERTRSIPVILFTALDVGDVKSDLVGLPAHVQYLGKESGPSALVDKVRQVMSAGGDNP